MVELEDGSNTIDIDLVPVFAFHPQKLAFYDRVWNNIDTSKDAQNYRKQTYNEQLADRTKELAYQKVNIEINSLSKVKGASVISPEFIARVKNPEVDR